MNQQQYWNEMAKFGATASVIDPNDHKGHKNGYIAKLRDYNILKSLDQAPESHIIDFGCGSGNLSKTLVQNGFRVTGVDISDELLQLAKQQQDTNNKWDVYHYDGKHLPFEDNSIDAITTYGVLIYIHNDEELINTLKEFHRILKPSGQVIAIEQATRKTIFSTDGSKKQREITDFLQKFQQSGLQLSHYKNIRRGHFPLLYAIRYGLVPKYFYNIMINLEKIIGHIVKKPILDYSDILFSLRK